MASVDDRGKGSGDRREDWLEWCALDECYADAGDEVGRKWDGVVAEHSGALFKAWAKAKDGKGIKLSRQVAKWRSVGVPLLPPAPQTKLPTNVTRRTDGLLRWLAKNATGDNLFNAACLLAEMGVTQDTATRLISGNLPLPSPRLGRGRVRLPNLPRLRMGRRKARPPKREKHMNQMNGHSRRAADGITDQELDEFLAKLNRELTPRMRRWAIALEMIENGYWPQDPEFLLDGALDVVLAIRDDAMNGLWLSLKLYSPEERERQLDEMVKSPVLREWLTLYRSNIARAEETKRKWAQRKAASQ